MRKIINKIFISLMILMVTSCSMESFRIYHAPLGFREIIIENQQKHNPILSDLYEGLLYNRVKIMEDTLQNRKKFPVLIFNYPLLEHYGTAIHLGDDGFPLNCQFVFKVKASFKLPGDGIFHPIFVNSNNSLCHYFGSFKKNYPLIIKEINKHTAHVLMNKLFYTYKSKVKVKRVVLNSTISKFLHFIRHGFSSKLSKTPIVHKATNPIVHKATNPIVHK
ncbi:hypothetical protein, partial [Pantoea sp. SoEX]|uniref:hypothetical protein n=1 Tax=Pantoea sp. SoEX TaxID=2576763 RepID=UPI00135AB798